MRVSLPDGCRGVDAPDGRIFRPERGRASVEIPDAALARAARRQYGAGIDAAFHFVTTNEKAAESTTCDSCGFERWGWVEACPRCSKEDI